MNHHNILAPRRLQTQEMQLSELRVGETLGFDNIIKWSYLFSQGYSWRKKKLQSKCGIMRKLNSPPLTILLFGLRF